jgi:hypothetical protein
MDLYATFPYPVEVVFGHLADPSHLEDWLPDVCAADPGPACGAGPAADPGPADSAAADFPLTVRVDGTEIAASGEVTAFEPPWLIGYRLFIGSRAHGLRVTCAVQAGQTQIHVRQPDNGTMLTIDLTRLGHALDAATR